MEMAVRALANLVTTPRQLPSVPVLQVVVSVAGPTLSVAKLGRFESIAQLAAPKRLLQVRPARLEML